MEQEQEHKQLHKVVDFNFESSQDGAHCFAKSYYPKAKLTKKVVHVIFQHGAIEYHKRHQEFFDHLRGEFGNRLVISTMDLVGHGLSGGSRAHIDKFDYYVEDFLKFIRIFHHLYQFHEVETHLVGHSLGGMIITKTLVDKADQIPFKISSVTLTNPCIKPLLELPKFVNELTIKLSKKLSKMRVPSLYDGFNLTSDRSRAIAFNHDPLNSDFVTVKMGVEILKTSKIITPYSYYIKHPMFFLLSGRDEVVDVEKTKLFMGGLNKAMTKESFYIDSKHDILNEICRKEVFQEISDYIKFKQWEQQCKST